MPYVIDFILVSCGIAIFIASSFITHFKRKLQLPWLQWFFMAIIGLLMIIASIFSAFFNLLLVYDYVLVIVAIIIFVLAAYEFDNDLEDYSLFKKK